MLANSIRILRNTLAILGSLTICGCSSLFYFPSDHIYTTPDQYGQTFEEVQFLSKDGIELTGWFIHNLSQQKSRGTIIQFHGNAQNMSSHFRSLAWLTQHQYNLFTFDYRGFGKSEGKTSTEGSIEDSIAAIEYVLAREDIKDNPVILIGQSIGGALAIAALTKASHDRIKYLVIESTFSSYRRIVREKLGSAWLTWPFQWPLSILVDDTYSPERMLAKLEHIPKLFIHGTGDKIIPAHHSQLLYDKASPPKTLWIVDQGQHIDTFVRHEEYREKLLNLFEKNLLANSYTAPPH